MMKSDVLVKCVEFYIQHMHKMLKQFLFTFSCDVQHCDDKYILFPVLIVLGVVEIEKY